MWFYLLQFPLLHFFSSQCRAGGETWWWRVSLPPTLPLVPFQVSLSPFPGTSFVPVWNNKISLVTVPVIPPQAREAVEALLKATECKCQDLPENCQGWSKEVKEAKLPSSHMDEQILAVLSPAARAHIPLSDAFREGICNHRQPQLYGPTDKHATGDDKWQQIFFLLSKEGEVGAPAPGRGGLFNLPGPLCRPQIVSSSNSCSRGGRSSTETYSCPSTNTAQPHQGSSPMGPTLSPAPPASLQTAWKIF